MAKVVWQSGIEYVSGALCKCGKKEPHKHGRMLSNSADSVWARQRFKAVAEMVHQRSRDLSKITQDQMTFIAQRNNPRGIKTMRAYYWHICGQEYDAQHPRE